MNRFILRQVKATLSECKVGDLSSSYWGKRIMLAAGHTREGVPRYFTDGDRQKAGDWTVCACGKLSPNIERHSAGDPFDESLRDLGVEFSTAVDVNDIQGAVKILVQIEERADAYLIEESQP